MLVTIYATFVMEILFITVYFLYEAYIQGLDLFPGGIRKVKISVFRS